MNSRKMHKLNVILNDKGRVRFQIYSLDYIIEKKNNSSYIVYSTLNPQFKEQYKNITTLFKNYKIYGENLKDNEDKIIIN